MNMKIGKFICIVPNQKKKSGTKCWLIGFVELSLQQFYLTEKKLKTFYN